VALDFDHRLFDVGVDTAEHAGEEVIAEQDRFCGDRLAVVVALMNATLASVTAANSSSPISGTSSAGMRPSLSSSG
jgi:hypothetical protein